jgi:hypothetical protein
MFWFVKLRPALLSPITVHSPSDLQGEVIAWNILAIKVGQVLQSLEGTAMTACSARCQPVVRADILPTGHLCTASLEEVLDRKTLAVKVVFQYCTLVCIAKDAIQTSGMEIHVWNRKDNVQLSSLKVIAVKDTYLLKF